MILEFWLFLIWAYNWLNDLASKVLGYSLRDGWSGSAVGDGFDRCAKRHRILLRAMEPFCFCTSTKNFALRYVSHEDPVETVLGDDRVSLMGVTPNAAFFAVVPDGVDVYDSREGAFVYSTQFDKAEELITMSLQNFLKLGEKVDVGHAKVLLLSNTSRCGSTLLTSMLEGLGQTQTVSEPDFLTHVSYYDGMRLRIPVEDILRVGFALQCKPLQSREVNFFVLKSRGFSAGLIPAVAKACPHVRHAFMFRNPERNIASIISMEKSVPWKKLLPMMMRHLTLEGSAFEAAIHEFAKEIDKNFTSVGFSSIIWGIMVLCFKESRDRFKIDIFPVSYDELLGDSIKIIGDLTDYCGYGRQGGLDKCLEALSRDSQANTSLSQKKLRKSKKKGGFTEEEKGVINRNFKKLGLPPVEQYMEIFTRSWR